jgi:hypothetical protein
MPTLQIALLRAVCLVPRSCSMPRTETSRQSSGEGVAVQLQLPLLVVVVEAEAERLPAGRPLSRGRVRLDPSRRPKRQRLLLQRLRRRAGR